MSGLSRVYRCQSWMISTFTLLRTYIKFNGIIHSNVISALSSRSSGELCGDVKYTFTWVKPFFYRSSTLIEYDEYSDGSVPQKNIYFELMKYSDHQTPSKTISSMKYYILISQVITFV